MIQPPKIMKLVSKEEFFYPQKPKQSSSNGGLQKLDESDKIWIIALGVFIAILIIFLLRKNL